LAGGTVVGFVAGVADALDFSTAARAGLFEAAVDGHAFAKGGDFFGEFAGGFGAEAVGPAGEAGADGFVEALDFGDGEFLSERERRKLGFPENFVGIGIADAAEEARVGEGALECMVGGEKSGCELLGSSAEDFEAAGVERAQTSFARDDVQRGALLGTRFGPEQGTVGEIEGSETTRRRNFGTAGLSAERVPVQSSGNHQMKNEPEVAFEADADAFAEAAQLQDLFTGGFGEGRVCGAQEKRTDNANGFECLPEDARFESLDVNGDVREFGHAIFLLKSQNAARTILQRGRHHCREGDTKATVVCRKGHNRLWQARRNVRELAGWPAKVFRREAARRTAYTKIVQKYS